MEDSVEGPRDLRWFGAVPPLEVQGEYKTRAVEDVQQDKLWPRTLKAIVDQMRVQDPQAALPVIFSVNPKKRSFFMLNKLAGLVLDTSVDPDIEEQEARVQEMPDDHQHNMDTSASEEDTTKAEFQRMVQEANEKPGETIVAMEEADKAQFFVYSCVFRHLHEAPYDAQWMWSRYESPHDFQKVDTELLEDGRAWRAGQRLHLHDRLYYLDQMSRQLLNGTAAQEFVSPPPDIQMLGVYYEETEEGLCSEELYQMRVDALMLLQKHFAQIRPAAPVGPDTDVFQECESLTQRNQKTLVDVMRSGDVLFLEQYLGATLLDPRTGEPVDEATRHLHLQETMQRIRKNHELFEELRQEPETPVVRGTVVRKRTRAPEDAEMTRDSLEAQQIASDTPAAAAVVIQQNRPMIRATRRGGQGRAAPRRSVCDMASAQQQQFLMEQQQQQQQQLGVAQPPPPPPPPPESDTAMDVEQ